MGRSLGADWTHVVVSRQPADIPGDWVLHSVNTGVVGASKWMGGSGSLDVVSIYDPSRHHGQWAFNGPDAWIFEIRPVGPVTPDRNSPDWFLCLVAKKLRMIQHGGPASRDR